MADILRKQNRMINGFADANKIDTDAGTFEDAEHNTYTGVTTDMISYDATNNQLLLKVGGADSVIPFSSGGVKLVDINPNKTNNIKINLMSKINVDYYAYIPVQGYKKFATSISGTYTYIYYSFVLRDGSITTESSGHLPVEEEWSDYIDIPSNAILIKLRLRYSSPGAATGIVEVPFYYSLLA